MIEFPLYNLKGTTIRKQREYFKYAYAFKMQHQLSRGYNFILCR